MSASWTIDPRLGLFAGKVRLFGDVASTNDIALEWGEDGEPEGAVAVAESQHEGRGRHGRSWNSPPGAGIYASVLLRPPDDALRLLTLAAGVALADGIGESTGVPIVLKWPNDLCVAREDDTLRKVGGILAEAGGDRQRHVVVGFGINVRAEAVPADLAARATALEVESGSAIDPVVVLTECLGAFSRIYRQLRVGQGAAVLETWRRRAARTFGRLVEWDEGGVVLQGAIDGIDGSGALLVRTPDGQRTVIAGEVRFRG